MLLSLLTTQGAGDIIIIPVLSKSIDFLKIRNGGPITGLSWLFLESSFLSYNFLENLNIQTSIYS